MDNASRLCTIADLGGHDAWRLRHHRHHDDGPSAAAVERLRGRGAILTGADMRPKRLAIANCAQYKNHAVLGDVQRVGDSVAGSWQSRA